MKLPKIVPIVPLAFASLITQLNLPASAQTWQTVDEFRYTAGNVYGAGRWNAGRGADQTESEGAPADRGAAQTISKPGSAITYVRAPLSFEPNLGQAGPGVDYISRAGGGTLLLGPGEAIVVLGAQPPESGTKQPTSSAAPQSTASRLKLVGANPNAKAVPADPLPGKVNYFFGKDPKQWRTNIPTYAKVTYKDVYPGVDLVYYGNQRQLEFDFIVSPSADPKQIALDFDGVDKVELDAQGNLVVTAAGGQLVQHKPLVYQMVNGARKDIAGGFKLNGEHRATFDVAGYDCSKSLVIDPVLTYASYLGGSFGDRGTAVALDPSGNFYVAGYTYSTDFPVLTPVQSFVSGATVAKFVTKFAPSGTMVYSTVLGGDRGIAGSVALVVDTSGNAYVASPAGFYWPTTPGAYQQSNGGSGVAKLSSDGSTLLYSTYLFPNGRDKAFGIAVDSAGAAYICGSTPSTDFPTTPGAFQRQYGGDSGTSSIDVGDAFITKLDPSGSYLVYSTYLGGTNSDIASAIRVDALGQAYVAGTTWSPNFPIAGNPFQPSIHGPPDAFVAKLNADGSALVYSTFLGGSLQDGVGDPNYTHMGLAIDSSGSAYVTGLTASPDFPTVNPLQSVNGGNPFNAFISKLSPDGSSLLYSTFLGCEYVTGGNGIALDAAGNIYVAGGAFSTGGQNCSQNFSPLLNPIPGTPTHGCGAAYVAKITADGQNLLYRTFLTSIIADDSIAVDGSGNAYVVGQSVAQDLPVTANAFQPTLNYQPHPIENDQDRGDAFVAIISSANEAPPSAPVPLVAGPYSALAAPSQCAARFPDPGGIDVSNVSGCAEMTYTQSPDPAGQGVVHLASSCCYGPRGGVPGPFMRFVFSSDFPVGTNVISCLVHDITGATNSFTLTFVVLDTQPPTITCPANVVANAPCGASSVAVNYPAPLATNDCPGLTVTSSPPSGSAFPTGTTTVNCTARNASGSTASCSFTVTVNASLFQFTGFLSPIGGADATGGSFSNPVRTFKLNSTIPVKFTAACSGSPVTSGIQTLEVIKYTSATTADTPIDATPTDAATTGDQFRLTDPSIGQWQFNLDTKATGMSTGIWLFQATLSDGSQHTAWIQIK